MGKQAAPGQRQAAKPQGTGHQCQQAGTARHRAPASRAARVASIRAGLVETLLSIENTLKNLRMGNRAVSS
jgi:hypothetical protein